MTVTNLRNALCLLSLATVTALVSACATVADKEQSTTKPLSTDQVTVAQTPAPANVSATVPLAPIKPKPRLSSQQAYIAQLLYQAEDAYARERLTTPSYDNAFDFYRRVLTMEPNNQAAVIGIERITRRYLALAAYADKHGQQKQADRYMSIARVVSPHHPLVRQWQKKVQLRQKKVRQQANSAVVGSADGSSANQSTVSAAVDAVRAGGEQLLAKPATEVALQHRYFLDRRDLAAKNLDIKSMLGNIAQHAKEQQSRLLIVARNDAEGRWIYQQMREAVKGFRLRGNIEYDAKPSVVLLDVGSPAD